MHKREAVKKVLEAEGLKTSTLLSFRELERRFKIVYNADPSRFMAFFQAYRGSQGPGSLVMAALSCFREEEAGPREGAGNLAFFARRNFYKECVNRLKRAGKALGLSRKEAPVFCNSRLPEKQAAYLGGLGFYGKNSLIIIPGLGSRFVLGGLLLPFEVDGTAPEPRGEGCGKCNLCRENCPVGALEQPGKVDRSRCLQALSTELVPMKEETRKAWGLRIYGCDSCQDCCPYNRNLKEETYPCTGERGPFIPLEEILSRNDEELMLYFRNSPMGMGWIDQKAILRNGIIAAGNSGSPDLIPRLEALLSHPHPLIREESEKSLNLIKKKQSFLPEFPF